MPMFYCPDGLITTDGQLHMKQSSTPGIDPSTGQLAVKLECGQFFEQPQFSLEWIVSFI